MTTQEILWTVLPNGLDDEGWCRVSVMVSPRLTTDTDPPELAEFDFADWPSLVNDTGFSVVIESNGVESVFEASREGALADSKLWSELFPTSTLVRAFQFRDYSGRKIRSFPVRSVLQYLNELYGSVAQSWGANLPPLPPAAGPYGGLLAELGVSVGHLRLPHGHKAREGLEEAARSLLRSRLGPRGAAGWPAWRSEHPELPTADALAAYGRHRRFDAAEPAFGNGAVIDPAATFDGDLGFESQAAMDYYLAHRFYDRPEMITGDAPPPPPAVPELDFHQVVGALGDYPVLLRRLGLVVDLTFKVDPPLNGRLRIVPSGVFSSSTQHRSPWTNFWREQNRFVAAAGPEASHLGDWMLRLSGVADVFDANPRLFDLVQVDVDGAALKLVNMASQMQSLAVDVVEDRAAFDTPEQTGLPSLRSAGIALVRPDRATSLATKLGEEKFRNATDDLGEVVHSAEHLLRGYRVDVHDIDSDTWYSLCRRKGIYRIVPETGPPVDLSPDGAPIVDEGYVKATSTTSGGGADDDLYLHETLFRWDGWSLVAPRPGRTIVAVAGVDGEGNPQLTEEPQKPASELATKFKLDVAFEPADGSLPRLRFGRSYALRVRTVDLAGNSIDFDQAGDTFSSMPLLYSRFEPISPPAVVPRRPFREGEAAERMVIRSDFDRTAAEYAGEVGQELPEVTYWPTNDRHLVPPKTSQLMAETHGMFDHAFGPSGKPTAAFAVAAREYATLERDHEGQLLPGTVRVAGQVPPDTTPSPDEEAPGSYLVNTEAKFPLAHLPDVMAKGVALVGLPGQDGTHRRDFTGDWETREPFVLRLAERPGAVAPGSCSQSFASDEPLVWDDSDRVLTVLLGKGETAVVRYSCFPMAERLGLMAVWQRWIQGSEGEADLTALALDGGHWMISPYRTLVLVHAVARPLCAPTLALTPTRLPARTYATLAGWAFLSIKSTGQVDLHATWSEPVDSLSATGPMTITGGGNVTSRRVDSWLPEQAPGEKGLMFPFPDKDGEQGGPDIRHEFGDTKHRIVDYRLTATTRFREYFDPRLTADPTRISRTGDAVAVDIPSSARPAAPRLLYVVPSFRWEPDSAPASWATFTRTRVGGGLRVWMRRPWFSSGAGERLGVVLWPGSPDSLPDALTRLVTHLGKDPIWTSADPGPALTAADFVNKVDYEQGLALPEATSGSSAVLDVVAFDPQYDPDRQLWFCDIDLSPKADKSYFPFVRLALARYQRHALPGMKLSPIVQADFAQLLPRRTLSVEVKSKSVVVSLTGPVHSDPTLENWADATLETHTGAIPGDLGWSAVPGVSTQLTVSGPVSGGGVATWTGSLDLVRGNTPLRVIVRELEHHVHDLDLPGPVTDAAQFSDRVVYADVVELPTT